MATIKDVAKKAGLSICTVSRALANKNNIRPETRERVLQAAKDIQYQPNKIAQSLRFGNTNTFGLILPDITNMYYSDFAKHIENYAEKKGYVVMLCNSDMSIKKERQSIEVLSQRNVDGIIALAISKEIDHIQGLVQKGIPYVLVNRDFVDDPHAIPSDNYYGGYTIIKHLIEYGHKNICAIFPSFNIPAYETRCHAAKATLKEHGLSDRFFLYDVNSNYEACAKVEALLEETDRPTAFFTANDMLAVGVYSAAYKYKLRIPEDISVVGYDNVAYSSMMIPPLTSFDQSVNEMVKKTIDYLLLQIKGNVPSEKKPEKVCGKLVSRESVSKLQ